MNVQMIIGTSTATWPCRSWNYKSALSILSTISQSPQSLITRSTSKNLRLVFCRCTPSSIWGETPSNVSQISTHRIATITAKLFQRPSKALLSSKEPTLSLWSTPSLVTICWPRYSQRRVPSRQSISRKVYSFRQRQKNQAEQLIQLVWGEERQGSERTEADWQRAE